MPNYKGILINYKVHGNYVEKFQNKYYCADKNYRTGHACMFKGT